jgi:hypothetical protein
MIKVVVGFCEWIWNFNQKSTDFIAGAHDIKNIKFRYNMIVIYFLDF